MPWTNLKDTEAVSPLIGMILALAISMALIGVLQNFAVPVWNSNEEANHYMKLKDQFMQIPGMLDNAENTKSSSNVYLDLGVEYPNRIFLISPPPSSSTVSTYANKVVITYTETTQYGNIVTSKEFETYAIKLKPNYYYTNPLTLTYEFGSVFEDGRIVSPVKLISGNQLSLEVIDTNFDTFSGTGTFNLNLQPIATGSSIRVLNCTLNFTTQFPTEWYRVFNSLGYNVTINGSWVNVTIDSPVTISLPYFMISKDIIGAKKLQAYRIIKLGVDTNILTGQSIDLAVKVVDYYENPVPGEKVEVNVTGTGYLLPDKINKTELSTDEDGIAEVTFSSDYPGTAIIWFNSSVGNVSYTITVASGSGPPVAMTLDLSAEVSGVTHYRMISTLRDLDGVPQPDYNVSFAANPFTVSVDPLINQTDINGEAKSIAGVDACSYELSNLTFGVFSKLEPWGTPYDQVSNLSIPNYPWNSGWKYKRDITITSPDLKTDYPVQITLSSGQFDFSNSNGKDLRFFANYTRTVYEMSITLRAYPVYKLPLTIYPPSFDIKRVNVTIHRDKWWNESWNYRKLIRFDSEGKFVRIELNSTNFDFSKSNGNDIRFVKNIRVAEIPIKITSPYSIAGYQLLLNITDRSILDLIADGSDLRFYSSQTSDPYVEPYSGIPYWIEELNDNQAKIWLKLDLIAGEQIIYMYAGNKSSPKSNFDSVFTKDPDAPADLGLLAEYHLDEGSGSVAHDDTSNGYTANLLNNPTWVGADGGVWDSRQDVSFSVGDSLSFDSSSDRMQLPHTILNGRTEVTFECWINTTDTNSFGIISGANSGTDNEYLIYYANNRLYQFIKGPSTSVRVTINDGVWHHIATVRHSNGDIDFYVDGELVGTGTLDSAPLVIDPNGLWIASEQDSVGGGWSTNQEFTGTIDEIKIYSRALSADEIRAHYERRVYAVEPEVEIWYPVRFIKEETIELPYFIEYWNSGLQKAVIWVKSEDPDAKFYMYYGNPSAVSSSDGSKVFRFFDDFDTWTGWTNYSSGWVEQFDLSGDYVLRKYGNNDPNGGYKQIGFTTSDFILIYRDYRRSGDVQSGSYNRVSVEDTGFNGYGILRRGYTTGSGWGDFGIERRDNARAYFLNRFYSIQMPINEWYTIILTKEGSNFTAKIFDENGLIKTLTASDATYSSFDRVAVRGGYTYYLQFIGVDDFYGFANYTFGVEEGKSWYGWFNVRIPIDFSSTSDGRDIRFFASEVTDPYAGGNLNHNLTISGDYFDIWVEIPSSEAFTSERTIYMYYGYPVASQIPMPSYTSSNITGFYSEAVNAGKKYLPLGSYQVPITITDEEVLIKMDEDANDIRIFEQEVADPYQNTSYKIPYWIESKNDSVLKLWVKVNLLAPKTIYIYYGKAGVASESNGNAVFDFFDDFSSYSGLNASKWEEFGTISYTTGDYLRIHGANGWIDTSNSGSYLVAKWNKGTLPDAFAVEWKQKVASVDAAEMGQLGVAMIKLDGSVVAFAGSEDDSTSTVLQNVFLTDNGVAYTNPISNEVEERFRLSKDGNSYILYRNENYVTQTTASSTPYAIAIGAGQNGEYLDLSLVDFIFVRKYSKYDSMLSYQISSPSKISYTSSEVLKPFKIVITDNNILSHIATSDGRDIRFFASEVSDPYAETSNSVPFYIEELTADKLSVWLKYEFIGETTIYMYYGDQSSAVQKSDPAAVFNPIDGVIGLWDFEDVSGDNVPDKSPFLNNGTAENGAFVVSGIKGKAMEFDGVNDYVIVPDNRYLSPQDDTGDEDTGELTIAAWVKVLGLNTDSHSQTREPIVSKGNSGEWEYALYVYDNYWFGNSIWQSGGSSHTEIVDTAHPFELGKWYFVAGVYEKGAYNKIYIFNETSYIGMYSSTTQYGNPGDGTSPLRIASRNDGQYLNAVVDDVIVLNRTLSFEELQEIKDSHFIKAGNIVAMSDYSRSPEVSLGSESVISNGTELKYCPYKMVEWDPGTKAVINITIPLLNAGDTTVEMYYGYDKAAPEECNIPTAYTLPYTIGPREEI
ncbi:MAG: DUF2341 domain-containing protein [Archaeoglobus sp.]|nr:DUF2341 domain-containing protein [Archaeoglobus sp.]